MSAVILKKRFILILLFIQTNVVAAPFLNMKTSVGDFTIELFDQACLLYTSPSPRDGLLSRMPSSA